MKNSIYCTVLLTVLLMAASVSAYAAGNTSIQAAIDAAQPGDVIRVPAGTYEEVIVLKDGITLVGEGADLSIIDGQGKPCVITGGKNAAVIGLTIRNGKTGICNAGKAIGIFDCRIRDCKQFGIRIDNNGCAVIANNVIEGNSRSTGIACFSSNPYIVNNFILNHRIGLMAVQHFMPQVSQNIFAGNDIGIKVAAEAFVMLSGNLFDANRVNIEGQDLSETDLVQPVDLTERSPFTHGKMEQYRALMDLVFEEKVAEHPLAVYDLTTDLGSFGVITLFPWASFSVAASAKDTVITDYEAYDLVTRQILNSAFEQMQNGHPAVRVNNAELKDQEQDRYVLDNLYIHPASYFAQNGLRCFKRETSFSRIEILLPAGYEMTDINLPAAVDVIDGQTVVKITDVGYTSIEMELAPAGNSTP